MIVPPINIVCVSFVIPTLLSIASAEDDFPSASSESTRTPHITAIGNKSDFDVTSTLMSSVQTLNYGQQYTDTPKYGISTEHPASNGTHNSEKEYLRLFSAAYHHSENAQNSLSEEADDAHPTSNRTRPTNFDPKNVGKVNLHSSRKFRTINQTLVQGVQEERHSSAEEYKVELDFHKSTHFPIDVKTCLSQFNDTTEHYTKITATSGIVYLVNNESLQSLPLLCQWTITVPEDLFIAARFEFSLRATDQLVKTSAVEANRVIARAMYYFSSMIYSSSNTLLFRATFIRSPLLTTASNFTMFYLFFTTVTRDGKRFLPAVMTSFTRGYVTSVGFGGKAGYSYCTNARHTLIVPLDHMVMARFRHVDIYHGKHLYDEVSVYEIHNLTLRVVTRISGQGPQPPRLHNKSVVINMVTQQRQIAGLGFKVEFSFHHFSDAPVMFDNGSLNCSGSTYVTFRHHVHCDLVRHCAGGEDEGGHCPFSSQLCQGDVALGTKCYKVFKEKTKLKWKEASRACKVRGGILAVMRTAEEWAAVNSVLRYSDWWTDAYVGLAKVAHTMPWMYWKMWVWSDGSVAYDLNIAEPTQYREIESLYCVKLDSRKRDYIQPMLCSKTILIYICEFNRKGKEVDKSDQHPKAVSPPDLAQMVCSLWSEYAITKCPSGHVTFTFLSCEPHIRCSAHQHQSFCTTLHQRRPEVKDRIQFHRDKLKGGSRRQAETTVSPAMSGESPMIQSGSVKRLVAVTVAMFACDVGPTTLPYSLVCDYVPHCLRGSDETFCFHGEKCRDVSCDNGLSFEQKCNNVFDCLDNSDELHCPFETEDKKKVKLRYHGRLPPPTIIDFDRRGEYSQQPMNESEPCPETHFPCLGVKSHCLPVYVRCNDVYDCLGREDEVACDRYECPGFYHCRKSRVCVHVNHTCDGWPQCPQRDDELYCGLTCPPDCLCQGLSVVCSVKFPAWEYPQTRYLDASHSHMKPADLYLNTFLVWLSLAACSINHFSNLTWPNVRYLDLSRNYLQHGSMGSFLHLHNLKTLILDGNPLVSLAAASTCFAYGSLKTLDLSNTKLREFDSDMLLCYPRITDLNISHCSLDKITEKGFQSIPYLSNIDLSGNTISYFPSDIFRRMDYLKSIWAENYKLCCKATLPVGFNENFCFAPQNEISSCDDLLKSNLFRACTWLFAALAVVGNMSCFFYKVLSKHRNPRSGFNVFVTNLTIADFLMGVYLVTVGVADEVYRGQYLWYDITWKTSTVCVIAGFLSLVSSEMSAFTICLITLDRFIVLTFPFTSIRFKGMSAILTCNLVWTIGIVLTSVPLFPVTSGWEFYGQTGICIPLPVTRKRFPGYDYAFGIMIILNFVLCVLIAVGQASIYWSVQANSMKCNSNRKSQDLVIARRLFTVAASDFLCWFPIGLLGLLSSDGVPVPSEVSVAMAVLVLPLNSALNPFLYTFNIVMEKRRKVREARWIKMIETRILSQQQRVQQNECVCGKRKPEQPQDENDSK